MRREDKIKSKDPVHPPKPNWLLNKVKDWKEKRDKYESTPFQDMDPKFPVYDELVKMGIDPNWCFNSPGWDEFWKEHMNDILNIPIPPKEERRGEYIGEIRNIPAPPKEEE